jgi:cytidine deaminase
MNVMSDLAAVSSSGAGVRPPRLEPTSSEDPMLERRASVMLSSMDLIRLVELARATRDRAYAPYSGFRVGASVLSESGNVYVGCNVENATYGATICAERAAICAMVAAGDTKLRAVAVFSDASPPATPCGICRQVLAEFAEDATVIVATPRLQKVLSLAQLLPEKFALFASDCAKEPR